MRTALISDIHGCFDVLQVVLEHIEQQKCDRILCLGDIVDGGVQNAEVVGFIRERNILTVRGNHDEGSMFESPFELSWELRQYLRALPESIVEEDVVYTHISPHPKPNAINTDFAAWNVFDDTAHRLIFIGHLHTPTIWGQKGAQPVSATKHEISYGEPFYLEPDNRYIICVGAIGQTRKWCPAPRYAIYDSVLQTITFQAPDVLLRAGVCSDPGEPQVGGGGKRDA